MSRILLVGAGAVGTRAARQLAEAAEVTDVLVSDADPERAQAVSGAIESCAAVESDAASELPDDLDAVAVASTGGTELPVVEQAIAQRVPVALACDDADALLQVIQLDAAAVDAGVTVAAGCGLAPGLADVMVRHAADDLDLIEEIRVARTGVAGPECTRAAHRARRGPSREWRDNTWEELTRRSRDETVWFPDPVGSVECRGVDGGSVLLARAFPEASRVSYRIAEPPARLASRIDRRRNAAQEEWGSARVEVWGRRGAALRTIVYGVVERSAVASGAVLALTAVRLAERGPDRIDHPGVHGLAALVEPTGFLSELAERGVTIAVFEGTAAS